MDGVMALFQNAHLRNSTHSELTDCPETPHSENRPIFFLLSGAFQPKLWKTRRHETHPISSGGRGPLSRFEPTTKTTFPIERSV